MLNDLFDLWLRFSDQISSLDSSIDSSGEPETKKIKAEIRNEKKNLANFFMATSTNDDSSTMAADTDGEL